MGVELGRSLEEWRVEKPYWGILCENNLFSIIGKESYLYAESQQRQVKEFAWGYAPEGKNMDSNQRP